MIALRAAAIVLVVVATAACNAAVDPTPSPGPTATPTAGPTQSGGQSPTATPTSSPGQTASPSQSPSLAPTASASTEPTASPSATPTTSPVAGWQLVVDFPYQGATSVDAIVALGDGFVAVGTRFDTGVTCFNDANHGRVWTSPDGRSWTAQPDDAFAQAEPWALFELGGALMVVGHVGSADPAASCNVPAVPGVHAWRSTDGGVTWLDLGRATGLDRARLTDVAIADGTVIAVGAPDALASERAGAWWSTDGLAWQAAETMPQRENRLTAVAARGNRVVAFADCCDAPLALISRDGGRNWFEASLTVPPIEPDDIAYPPAITDIAAVDAGFVAVGYACCLYPAPDQVPITLVSADGEDWTAAWLPVEHEEIMSRLGVLPTGLVAVGNGTYETGTRPPTDPQRFGGRSWISVDGTDWQPGPRFMELGAGYVTTLAAGPAGVVIGGAGTSPGGPQIWFAPADVLQ